MFERDFTPDRDSEVVLAFDLGGTKLAAALVVGQNVLERRQTLTPANRTPENIVHTLLELATDWLERASRVAVAATGHVQRGRVTAPNQRTLPWTEVDLEGMLERATGKLTAVLNDADAAAWGEYRYGAGIGSCRMLFVTISTGVGAGLVLEGRLLEGAELGFTRLEDGTPLEFMASGKVLGEYALGRGWRDARDVLEHASTDPDAEATLERAAQLISGKLFDAFKLLSLERVVVGGGLGLAPGFLKRLENALEYGPAVARAELGADAGLIGAADWARSLR